MAKGKNNLFSSATSGQILGRSKMKIQRGAVLALAFCSLMFTSSSYADKLCLKVLFNKKKQTVSTSSVTAANCPKGFKELVDTSTFVGPQGPAGTNGTNGSNGTNGFVPLSQCVFGSTTGVACPDGAVCDTELSCSSVSGSTSGAYMISWVFDISNKSGYIVRSTNLVPSGSQYPTGVRISTTSEETFGTHTASLGIVCCPAS